MAAEDLPYDPVVAQALGYNLLPTVNPIVPLPIAFAPDGVTNVQATPPNDGSPDPPFPPVFSGGGAA